MASDLIPRRPVTCSFYRRRRILLIPALLFAFCMFFSSPWSLPPLNLSGISSSISRANIVSLVKGPPVEEIYGLLHFVTSDDDRMLSHSVNPAAPIDLNEYLGGDKPDWKSHMRRLKEEYPLIVFSKKTKKLLESYNLSPPPKIIEVDLRDDWDFMKLILTRKLKKMFENAGMTVREDTMKEQETQ
ncbi:hypothetical protein BD769DRAFT_1448067 [Suillus cothurnatus]|nr:hypothetical protein BD769DRAFT_1448067 [Suillus cothurnatus]